MQCDYCGATLPDIDFPMVYKELREENGRLEYEHGEATKQRNRMDKENKELEKQVRKLKSEVVEEKKSKSNAQVLMVLGWVAAAIFLCASVGGLVT